MKYLTLILSLLSTQLLTGCFQSAVAVRIKPDGSGTIDKVFSMSIAQLQQVKQMQGAAGGGAKPPTEIDETRLKAAAAKLGEGVTFVSAKKLALTGHEGYVATYAFNDITKVKVKPMPEMAEGGEGVKVEEDQEPITFQFTKGSPAELTIISPVEKKKPSPGPGAPDAMVEKMMAQMFKDMRVSLVVDVQGTIVKTNASAANRQGQRVTLMDVDFGKMLADPAKLKAIAKIKDPASPEAKALLRTVPGVKMELENPVRISFK